MVFKARSIFKKSITTYTINFIRPLFVSILMQPIVKTHAYFLEIYLAREVMEVYLLSYSLLNLTVSKTFLTNP